MPSNIRSNAPNLYTSAVYFSRNMNDEKAQIIELSITLYKRYREVKSIIQYI